MAHSVESSRPLIFKQHVINDFVASPDYVLETSSLQSDIAEDREQWRELVATSTAESSRSTKT